MVTEEEISNTVQEMFVRYLAEQAHNVVKSERKPRKNIQYKDLGMFLYYSFKCVEFNTR